MENTSLLEENSHVQVAPEDKSKTNQLWKIAGILLFVTLIEFAIAFFLPESWKWAKISLFVGLTIVKSFYIIGEFMHLRHEKKVLIWSILLPTIFVVWFIMAMIYEGGSILNVR